MEAILLTTLNAKYIHLNLAVRLLFDLNRKKGGLAWKEYTIKDDFQQIAREMSTYDVVCFSCYIWNITQTLEVAEILKSLNPGIKILLGGPEVSYEWEPVIALPCVDYIITGEGEIPFGAFMDNYPDLQAVPNLIYKREGHIHYQKQSVQFDLRLLEHRNPYQYDLPEDLYNKVSYIETSRGCPYKCEFCLASLDNKVRYLPMDTIKNNLLYLMKHGRVIKFLDRTFNVKKDFTLELFDFILAHHKPGNVFQFEITADIVHPDIIRFIQDRVPKGLFRFEIGIQTVNQESNREVSRKQNFDKTAGVIKQLDQVIDMHLDLIVGLPLEYWKDLKFSFESTFKLYPPELQLGFLKFLKGTPVREKYERYGYEFDPNPPYQIIRSNFMSKEELDNIILLENALEIYWNKHRALNTLKYVAECYSIFDFLQELGTFFASRSLFHRHTLKDVFQILFDFTNEFCAEDRVLKDLVVMDYYLYHKQKPQDIFGVEGDRRFINKCIEELGLNHHKFRFIIWPITFDLSKFIHSTAVEKATDRIIIVFDGRSKSRLLLQQEQTAPVMPVL